MEWPKLKVQVKELGAGAVAVDVNVMVNPDNVAAAVDEDRKAKVLYTLLLGAAQLSVEMRQETEDAHGQYKKLLAKAEAAWVGAS